jgi:hypothetical protein
MGQRWVNERKKAKGRDTAAAVGRMGTIGNCLPGDLVACESLDRKRIIWLEIAWMWVDGKGAQVRIWSKRHGAITTHRRYMREVKASQRVRWLGVRAK